MVWLAENIQACLRDFLAATASMARKRHLASNARGFYCFCLSPSIRKRIRPIRGRKRAYPLAYCPPGRGFSLSSDPRALPPVTHGSALQAPERMWIRMLKTSNPW